MHVCCVLQASYDDDDDDDGDEDEEMARQLERELNGLRRRPQRVSCGMAVCAWWYAVVKRGVSK